MIYKLEGLPRAGALIVVRVMACQSCFTVAAAADSSSTDLQEIVVTAKKRAEQLQDVPMGITVLNTADLVEQNTNKLQDYVKSIPGRSLTSQDQGTQLLVVRGVTTGRHLGGLEQGYR